jgi:hypothetical protein
MKTITKNEIKTGDILLVSGVSWLSKQIQKSQKRDSICKLDHRWLFNHTDVFWWCYDELFVVGAQKKGIEEEIFENYITPERQYLVLKPTFKIDGSEYGRLLLEYVRKYGTKTKYAKWDLIHHLRQIFKGKWKGEKKQDGKRFTCGEFGHHVHKYFKPKLFPENSAEVRPCHFLAMGELFEVCKLELEV